MEPTPYQIMEWKTKYNEIFSADSPRGDLYVFRSLTIGEQAYLRNMAQTRTLFDAEEYIISCGILFPDKEIVDKAPTNFISSIASEIREVSGFGNAKTAKKVLNNARDESSLLINVAKTYILATMPAYREEDLDKLTFEQLCHKVAIAEKIIEINQQVMAGNQVTMEILDPEEIAELEREEEEAKKKEEYKRQKMYEKFQRSEKGFYSDEEEGPVKPKITPEDPIAAKLRNSLG